MGALLTKGNEIPTLSPAPTGQASPPFSPSPVPTEVSGTRFSDSFVSLCSLWSSSLASGLCLEELFFSAVEPEVVLSLVFGDDFLLSPGVVLLLFLFENGDGELELLDDDDDDDEVRSLRLLLFPDRESLLVRLLDLVSDLGLHLSLESNFDLWFKDLELDLDLDRDL